VENNIAPEKEQAVCVTCGLCCDGTLFGHAVLMPEERGNLPALIEQNAFVMDGKDYFRLPCLCFSDLCTIYNSSRAYVCGSYRCRLLADMAGGSILPGEAVDIVRQAKQMRHELQEAYNSFAGTAGVIPLTRILRELGKYHEGPDGNGPHDGTYELLQARYNIFEALLIRHFRPEGVFEKMVMK
jgi:hypothetical protein